MTLVGVERIEPQRLEPFPVGVTAKGSLTNALDLREQAAISYRDGKVAQDLGTEFVFTRFAKLQGENRGANADAGRNRNGDAAEYFLRSCGKAPLRNR